jgi:hypothetical protein
MHVAESGKTRLFKNPTPRGYLSQPPKCQGLEPQSGNKQPPGQERNSVMSLPSTFIM